MRHFTLVLLIALSTMMACKPKNEGNVKIFKYNQASGITSLDPAFAKNQANIWACSQFFNGLVEIDQNMLIKPSIAKSWDFSDDGLSITFKLKDDIFFHPHEAFEGVPRKVTAHDFEYSFNRIIDPKVASSGAWIFNGKVDSIQPFVAINDSTFQVNLQGAFSPIMGLLCMPYCYVVPKEVVEFYGKDFRAHPVGTGPFKFKVWEEGTALVGLKNDKYFEKDETGIPLPYVDGFKVTFMESKKMEYLSFMKGDLDLISGIDKSFVNELLTEDALLQEQWKDRLVLYKVPFLNTEYLGFNMIGETPWFHYKEFRQALNYCFDREAMIKYLRKGVGAPAINGFIPKGLPPYSSQNTLGYDYQPEKAKELLRSINYQGEEIVLNTNETYKDIALYLANEAEKVGVNMKIEVVQSSLLREWMVNGQVDFFRGSWIADYPDAENYLSLFYSENSAPPNYTRFDNELYDSLYVTSFEIGELEARLPLYSKMDSILIEEAPVVFLYYDELIRICQANIEGAEPNAFNALPIKHFKKN